MFKAKDFIETAQGLLFAVVAHGTEQGRVRCFLRYVRTGTQWQKVNTAQANALLGRDYPQYVFASSELAALVHGVDTTAICQHYAPQARLQTLLHSPPRDAVENDVLALMLLLQQRGVNSLHWGVTGSILPRVHHAQSDIDLVCYSLSEFARVRAALGQLIAAQLLSPLSLSDWQRSYQRRACALSCAEYIWHEQRKQNKCLIHGRKVDISCVSAPEPVKHYQKLAAIVLQARVTDASLAFAYPAQWSIAHARIKTVVCFTATYTGQARDGELIEAAGLVEQSADGTQRLVVGSSREAAGEYIKVIDALGLMGLAASKKQAC